MKYTSEWLLARFETLLSESYEMKMARVLLLLIWVCFFAWNAYTCLIINICVLIFWLSNERHIYETWYLTMGHDLFFHTYILKLCINITLVFFSQVRAIANYNFWQNLMTQYKLPRPLKYSHNTPVSYCFLEIITKV